MHYYEMLSFAHGFTRYLYQYNLTKKEAIILAGIHIAIAHFMLRMCYIFLCQSTMLTIEKAIQ